jgi:hypothetical protein
MKSTGCLMTFLSRRPWSSSQFVRRWRYQFTGLYCQRHVVPTSRFCAGVDEFGEEPHGRARITVLSGQCEFAAHECGRSGTR